MMHREKNSGFTIIEIVLVLAIAGLIFLIVFLALPQLQRSRRDTQRKGDLAEFSASLDSYASKNLGSYPRSSTIGGFAAAYFADQIDPSTGEEYDVTYLSASHSNRLPEVGEIMVDTSNARCVHGSDTVVNSPNLDDGSPFSYADPDSPGNVADKRYAIAIGLEAGYYCLDNLTSGR